MMESYKGYWITGSAVPGPPYNTHYWESFGTILKDGRLGSVVEVVSFKTLVSGSTCADWPSFMRWKLAGSPATIYCPQSEMVRYLFRNCPRCANYVGIVLREPRRNTPLQAVNGHCLKCDYRLDWTVIQGTRGSVPSPNNNLSSSNGTN